MPVPAPRDPGAARDILTGWLGDPARLPGARITDLRTPEFTGFSSEILMADVKHGGGAEALAVRVAPSHYQVFPETRFAEQYRLMRLRGHRHPGAPLLWYEPDPGVPRRAVHRDAADRRAGCRPTCRPTTPAAGSPRSAQPSGRPCGGLAWTSWPGCTGST